MTHLVSMNPEYEVRKARSSKPCYGADKWWRSERCSGRIRKGSIYVAKITRGVVCGKWRWLHDDRRYCSDCALKALGCIAAVPEKVVAA